MSRKCFTWMPPLCVSDLKSGALFYMFSSFLMFIWAAVRMVNINKDYWRGDQIVPLTEEHVTYALLMFMGFTYFAASAVTYRASSEQLPRPLLGSIEHFETDELLATWLYFTATFTTVPIAAIYTWYYDGGAYGFALAVSICINIFFLLCVWGYYPDEKTGRPFFTGKCLDCLGRQSSLAPVIRRDIQLALWIMYVIGLFSIVICFGMLMYNVREDHYNKRNVWDYATAGFTVCFIELGTTYFLAGLSAVEVEIENDEGEMTDLAAEKLAAHAEEMNKVYEDDMSRV